MADEHEHHDSTMEMGETQGTDAHQGAHEDALTGMETMADAHEHHDSTMELGETQGTGAYQGFHEEALTGMTMAQLAAHMRQFMVDDGFRESKDQVVQKILYQYMKAKKLDFAAAQFLEEAKLGDNPELPKFGFNTTAGKNLFDDLEDRVLNQQPEADLEDRVPNQQPEVDRVEVIEEDAVEDGAVVPQLLPMVEPPAVQNRVEIFSKPLTPSDVGQSPGVSASLLVPKHALGHLKRFPNILKNGAVIGHIITATDINGQNWSFKMMRHQYRGSYQLRNQRYRFVIQNGLGVSFIIRFEMIDEVLHIFWEPPPQNVE